MSLLNKIITFLSEEYIENMRKIIIVTQAVYFVVFLIFGYFDQRARYEPVDGHEIQYIDYVSNWNEICCSIWAVLNAINILCPAD